jgi:hypothetical protein
VLLRLDPVTQAFHGVVRPHLDTPLGQDWPLIDILGDHVDGAASLGNARL